MDPNPIENLWAFNKHQLQDRDASSLPKLQNAIQEIWDNINKEYLQTLADSLPKQLQMVPYTLLILVTSHILLFLIPLIIHNRVLENQCLLPPLQYWQT